MLQEASNIIACRKILPRLTIGENIMTFPMSRVRPRSCPICTDTDAFHVALVFVLIAIAGFFSRKVSGIQFESTQLYPLAICPHPLTRDAYDIHLLACILHLDPGPIRKLVYQLYFPLTQKQQVSVQLGGGQDSPSYMLLGCHTAVFKA